MLGFLAGAASPIEAPHAHLAIAVDSTPVGAGLPLAWSRLADFIDCRDLRALRPSWSLPRSLVHAHPHSKSGRGGAHLPGPLRPLGELLEGDDT